MKLFPRLHKGDIRRIAVTVLAFALVASSPYQSTAQAPGWWQQRGVLSGQAADDYSAINQGQLKQLAKGAVLELEARLPGGAGAPLLQLLDRWAHPTVPPPDDYAAVNLGQLKAVAAPVYDRFMAVGYVSNYPWVGSATPPDDYALANLGQTKALFAFDLTRDSDGDGYTDEVELAAGSDPNNPNSFPWDLGDPDGDGIPNLEDARPRDPNIGRLIISITTPLDGTTVP